MIVSRSIQAIILNPLAFLKNLGFMHKPTLFAMLLLGSLTAGCSNSWTPKWVQVHRIDITQGNIVTPEQFARLEKGMGREEVRFLLGTPLLQDPFHPDRWDYLYYHKPGKGEVTQRNLTLYFEDGRLARIEGEPAPAEQGAAPGAESRTDG